jgi:nucleoside-diphosphate-sugar epimerase
VNRQLTEDKIRVLVTGGSGFIGTNVLDHLTVGGRYEVLNLDIAAPGHPGHRAWWREVDLLDRATLRAAIGNFNPHIVLHLAARTDLGGSRVDDYPANTLGVQHLLEALDTAPALHRAIFASSMLVCSVGHRPASPLEFCPANAYGESKVKGEQILRNRPPPCTWTIVRPTSIWGPWFKEPYRTFFDYVRAGRYFHVGSTRVRKTYGYVGNAAVQLEGLMHAESDLVNGQVFYLGDSADYVIRDWAEEIAERSGVRVPTLPSPLVHAAALLGDALKIAGFPFPMTRFRLRNMTTENRMDLAPIFQVAPTLPFDRKTAIDITLRWMDEHPNV